MLEDKYKVIMTAVTKMQYCVPGGREKDIRAGCLKLITNKKLKAGIWLTVPSKGI